MRKTLPFLGLWCAVATTAVPGGGAAQPTLGEGRCRLVAEGLPAAYARCETVAVPLDPAEPDGPTVDLFVARIAALSAEPRPDPLV